MYDPFMSLLCGILGSSLKHLWCMPFSLRYFVFLALGIVTLSSLSPYF